MDFERSIKFCNDQQQQERWIKHYSNLHKILLVGEGDFSFAACLARAFGSATNMVATSLHHKATVISQHPTAETNLEVLMMLGCSIVHGVDASIMSIISPVNTMKFDRIVYNFPHSGSFSESDIITILSHQAVVRGFFKNACDMLTANGEVHVTHKTTYPFSEWQIEQLAQYEGLCLIEKVRFTLFDYPGYVNKKGAGSKSNESFPVGECSTFKFARTRSYINSSLLQF
ncbi:hypothetical protein IFM89_022996 [Coptis chinensis]|uniref:25S rRNA (uridine-N(3))-methyltransferase BMT5-like domain-containing protein n=1 Tax=Coptis chinensis TaxID=261450 RepID=A0A835IC92_9MAGN|nr:hypothetical protein IFM89_022996 [Coptis chinensis]